MAVNPLKMFLFVLGGTVAASAAAWWTGAWRSSGEPWSGGMAGTELSAPEGSPPARGNRIAGAQGAGETEVVAEQEAAGEAASTATAGRVTGQGTAEESASAAPSGEADPAASTEPGSAQTREPEGQQSATLDAGAPAEQDQPKSDAPSFDLLRVEGDGETVVAGQAEPGSKVDLTLNGVSLGSAVAGAGGDFAIVLDKPLPPGAHQLSLASTDKAGGTTASEQTAVVSVPEQRTGQVLAMVEQPGSASRILTPPENLASASAPADAKTQPAGRQGSAETGQGAAAQEPPANAPTETAAAQPAAPSASAVADAGEETSAEVVAVQAVEIEGSKIFVAGAAPAGTTVRVYAGASLLGDAKATAGGEFLVEATKDLPVGNYVIRADVIGARGEVTARAAVPFQREPGEAMAAVAPSVAQEAGAVANPTAQTAQGGTQGAGEQAAVGTGGAASQEQPVAGGVKSSQGGETAAAAGNQVEENAAADLSRGAEGAVMVPEKPAGSASSSATATGLAGAQSGGATGGANENQAQTAASGSAGQSAGAPAAEAGAVVAAPAGETELSPPLQSADGAVIIRRGDNLWRISKRVYGRGTRYATIYLANQKQIRDPDMIMPGQIFSVPQRSEEGETADMNALGEQSVPASNIQ